MRQIYHLKYNWRFTREDTDGAGATDHDDSAWQDVRVPHDWAISGPFERDNDLQTTQIVEDGQVEDMVHTGRTGGLPHTGVGWYRRHLGLPTEPGALNGKRVWLEFDGVMSHCRVFLNGADVGGWPYGYASFSLDITGAAVAGDNVLAVRVENPPSASRWYPGAGIYRNVRLVITNEICVGQWGVSVTCPVIDASETRVAVATRVEGPEAPTGIDLETTILDGDGAVVARDQAAAELGAEAVIDQGLSVPNPRLWSPDAPELYTVRSVVRVAGEAVDEYETRFGIRTVEMSADRGLVVNAEPERFNGVCMHHDLGPLGAALNVAALRRQLELLKGIGCNAIRTSHNPPAPELLDLCDEMGFYVIDEAFDEWRDGKCANGYNTLFDTWAERDLRAMIRRDRNHPCVVMWSIGNEIHEQGLPGGREVAEMLTRICHNEDPTRPVTAGFNDSDEAIANGLADAVDVPGWNYKPHAYARYRQEHPAWPMYGSETASTVSSRDEFYLPADEEKPTARQNLQVNSYDLSTTHWSTTPDQEFTALDENPTIMGEFVWTGFDYLGEPTPYYIEWPSHSSYFGIFDLAGLPKSRAWLYRSRWSDEPTLYLLPHWTWDANPGAAANPGPLAIPVHCYSNHAAVELFVNGVSQGRRTRSEKTLLNRHRFVWPAVCYEPGELRAVGYNENGDAVGEFTRRTAGPAATVRLESNRTSVAGDGEDMVFITATVTDAAGEPVPNSDHPVTFTVTGPAEIAGVCNGDAANTRVMNSGGAGTREAVMEAFHGRCVLYLRSAAGAGGAVTVAAGGAGLAEGTLGVDAIAGI